LLELQERGSIYQHGQEEPLKEYSVGNSGSMVAMMECRAITFMRAGFSYGKVKSYKDHILEDNLRQHQQNGGGNIEGIWG